MPDPVWVDGVTPLNSVNMTKVQTRDEKAAANGYASLDATAKVPVAQLPSTVPTGAMLDFAGAAAPAGWLLCDGSAVSRSTYNVLFGIVGTAYGPGDGSSTFNLPDYRGRVAVGQGSHADVAALGASDGLAVATRRPKHNHSNGVTANHNLTASHNLSLPAHVHAVNDPGHAHMVYLGRSGGPYQGSDTMDSTSDSFANVASATTGVTVGNPTSSPAIPGGVVVNGGVTVAGVIGPAGTNAVDATPYLVANKIIKT